VDRVQGERSRVKKKVAVTRMRAPIWCVRVQRGWWWWCGDIALHLLDELMEDLAWSREEDSRKGRVLGSG